MTKSEGFFRAIRGKRIGGLHNYRQATFTARPSVQQVRGRMVGRSVMLALGLAILLQHDVIPEAFSRSLWGMEAGEKGTPKENDSFAITPGDRIKIQFFSELSLKAPKPGNVDQSAAILNSFYERSDISGEFEIGKDNELSHPLLGIFNTLEMQPQELEGALRDAYQRTADTAIKVRVSFVQRPPVYVLGLVTHPGAYQYIQGMTLAQVVALASGLYRQDGPQRSPKDAHLESIRIEKSEKMLQHILLRKAALLAEFNGKELISVTPELIELVGKETAGKLIAAENVHYRRIRSVQILRERKLKEEVSLAGEELKALLSRKQNLVSQQTVVEKKLLRYRDMYQTANMRASMRANKDLASFELQHLTLLNDQTKISSEMLQAEHKKLQVEQELLSVRTADLSRLKQELAALNEQQIETEGDLDLARGTLSETSRLAFENDASGVKGSRSKVVYEITRRGKDDFVTFTAGANSYLKPGDVVRIKYDTDAS